VGLSAVCPHQNCLVNEVTDQKIICPCHGSEFSITDGAVIQGPATSGLSSVAVSVNGDQVVLG
jgi:Rieske Fe-S protein